YSRSGSAANLPKIETHLQSIVENVPANLPARLQLAETLLRNNKPNDSSVHLRIVRQEVPELPNNSAFYLEKALTAIQSSQKEEALTNAIAFHNILKQLPLYRQGIVELSGQGGSAIGFPVVNFSKSFSVKASAKGLGNLKFVESANVLENGTF